MRQINRVKITEWLFVALGILIYFSYFPLINFGTNEGLHFDLSLTQIGLVILVILGLPDVWRARGKLMKKKSVWVTGAFVLWNILSLLWTGNLIRGILTVGIIGALWLVFLWLIAKANRRLIEDFLRVMVWAGVGIGIFAVWQMVAGALGLSANWTMLCNTCGANIFGFARPNGFAVEPQFLGSLLLAPIIVVAIKILKGKTTGKEWILLGFLSMILFLTMSRGAIYAFVIAGIVLCVVAWKKWKLLLLEVGVVAGAFLIGLLMQGAMTQINPRVSDDFRDGVAKSAHQMSMGLVDFRVKTEQTEDSADLGGYVEESTEIRLSLSEMAWEGIMNSPRNFVIGVGIGGTGVALAEMFETWSLEITQNEYLEIWLELGIIGIILFGAILIGLMKGLRKNAAWYALIAAYGIQWVFFSGYPNALHIYIILGAIYVAYSDVITSRRGR